jgi:hypothetical protein
MAARKAELKKADRGHSLKARWRGHGQHERIPSTGRRPIVIKTAAEPHGFEALVEERPVAVLWSANLACCIP